MEWSNLKIGAKDVLAALIFAFTSSGVYYKVYYEGQKKEAIETINSAILEKRLQLMEAKVSRLEEWQRKIDDDNIRREAQENERYRINATMRKTK